MWMMRRRSIQTLVQTRSLQSELQKTTASSIARSGMSAFLMHSSLYPLWYGTFPFPALRPRRPLSVAFTRCVQEKSMAGNVAAVFTDKSDPLLYVTPALASFLCCTSLRLGFIFRSTRVEIEENAARYFPDPDEVLRCMRGCRYPHAKTVPRKRQLAVVATHTGVVVMNVDFMNDSATVCKLGVPASSVSGYRLGPRDDIRPAMLMTRRNRACVEISLPYADLHAFRWLISAVFTGDMPPEVTALLAISVNEIFDIVQRDCASVVPMFAHELTRAVQGKKKTDFQTSGYMMRGIREAQYTSAMSLLDPLRSAAKACRRLLWDFGNQSSGSMGMGIR